MFADVDTSLVAFEVREGRVINVVALNEIKRAQLKRKI